MTANGPGKSDREGISIFALHRMFPDDAAAERWFIETRWPGGVECPKCGSDNIQERPTRKPAPYRCRDCRKDFSVKTGTLMHDSKLGYQVWVFAIYLMNTSLKGQSSMKLHRELGITQKTAWHLAHRIREAFEDEHNPFSGPVEVDETFVGGKRRNMHAKVRKQMAGRGGAGKTAVIGAKDRNTNQVTAKVIDSVDRPTLQGFVGVHAADGAVVYTDDASAYVGIPFTHDTVNHSHGQYVDGDCHTNGMESFWSILKRGITGTYHRMSPKHLDRYAREFSGRHNIRSENTIDQMTLVAEGMIGKRLTYKTLIRPNGRKSGARPVSQPG